MLYQSEERNSESVKISGEGKWGDPDFILSDSNWKRHFDASGEFIAFIDPEHRFVRVNQAFANKLGKSASSLVGTSCCLAIHGTGAPVLSCPMSIYKQGIRETHIFEPQSPALGLVRCKSIPFFSPAGEFLGCLHIATPLAEPAPPHDDRSAEKYELIHAFPFPAVVADQDAVIRACSTAFNELVSLETGTSLAGISLLPFIGPDPSPLLRLLQEAAAGMQAAGGEILLQRRNMVPVRVSVSAKRVNTGAEANPEFLLMFSSMPAGDAQSRSSELEHLRQRLFNRVLLSLTGPCEQNCMKIISFLGEVTRASAVALTAPQRAPRLIVWKSPLYSDVPIDAAVNAVESEIKAVHEEEVYIRMPELAVYLARAGKVPSKEKVGCIAGIALGAPDKEQAFITLTFPGDLTWSASDRELVRMAMSALNLELWGHNTVSAIPAQDTSVFLETQGQISELQEIIKGRDKLFSIIAHDLKNPFQGLLGFIDLVTEDFDTLTAGEVKAYLENIRKASYETYSLLENLLEWSRIQPGKRTLQPTRFDLHREVGSVIEQLGSNALHKRIALYNELPQNIQVEADRNMIHSVVLNLIANAIKFTGPDGHVVVSGTHTLAAPKTSEHLTKKWFQVNVTDDGVGIPADVIAQLFTPDTTVSSVGTLNEHGTGLGLVISKEMVEMNGGQLTVQSKEGQGSVFSFTLPLA